MDIETKKLAKKIKNNNPKLYNFLGDEAIIMIYNMRKRRGLE